jgi:butyrate kinase
LKGKQYRILTINPGSTSTKLGLFTNLDPVFARTIRHSKIELAEFATVWDQYSFRKAAILDLLAQESVPVSSFSAVVGRGGLLRPMEGGVYRVNQAMIADARSGVQGHHPSNLGCVLAYGIAWTAKLPAFIVDSPCVDEFEPLARYSGLPEIPRRSLSHALNIHAVARKVAQDLGKVLEETRFVVAHLGGGITVSPVKGGRIIDANNATSAGPFSPERTGTLPLMDFIELCFSGKYSKEQLRRKVMGEGGLVAYLGQNSAAAVEEMIAAGDEKAAEIYEAMAYDISKEIGAMATVLNCDLDAIVLTGGLANSKMLVTWITERVGTLADIVVQPGEDELLALAAGALRVLRGEEEVKEY